MVENDWDVVSYQHTNQYGFVSDAYELENSSIDSVVANCLPFDLLFKLRNGQIIRVKKKEGK